MRRQADHRISADDLAGCPGCQIVLAEVQHVSAAGIGDIGAVVHRQQRSVRLAGRPEHLQVAQLLASLQALLAQLDDIDAAAEHLVKEAAQVTLALPRVGAQVQPCRGQPGPQLLRALRHAQKASA